MQQEFQQAARALAQGDLDTAMVAVRALLDALPDHAGVQHIAGVVFYETGDAVRGAQLLDAAARTEPRNPEIAYNHGSALLKQRQDEAAAAHLQRCIELAPQHASAHNNLGTALQNLGRHREAQAAFERALAINPRHAGALVNLGGLALASDRFRDALDLFKRAISLNPGSGGAWAGRGQAELALGQVSQACGSLERSVELAPADAAAWGALARARTEGVDFDGAVRAAQRVTELVPDDPDAWNNLGSAATSMGDLAAAEKALRQALSMAVQHREATVNLAALLELANRTREALALAPADAADPRLRLTRAKCLLRDGELEAAATLLAPLADNHEDPWLAKDAAFTLGKLEDRRGHADAAWACYLRGNQRAGELWHSVDRRPDTFAPALDAIARGLQGDRRWMVREAADDRRPPAFLFGFQRSGTTLLDTVLGVHPDVVVMEEQPVINRVIATMTERFAVYPEGLRELDESALALLRDRYFEVAREVSGYAGQGLLLDKSPLHTVHLGLIRMLFPEAPLVLVLRHPLDVCLSCFMQDFTMSAFMTHFLSVEGVAAVYRQVFDLWLELEPDLASSTHVIRYEDLVEDPPARLRSLVDYLGLDWREAFLDHTGAARERGLINTPSYEQVTRPIYRSAQGRWRRYAGKLEHCRRELEPFIKRFGYADEAAEGSTNA